MLNAISHEVENCFWFRYQQMAICLNKIISKGLSLKNYCLISLLCWAGSIEEKSGAKSAYFLYPNLSNYITIKIVRHIKFWFLNDAIFHYISVSQQILYTLSHFAHLFWGTFCLIFVYNPGKTKILWVIKLPFLRIISKLTSRKNVPIWPQPKRDPF